MRQDSLHLNELLEVLSDGDSLYLQAIDQASEPDLAALLSRIRSEKKRFMESLAARVRAEGETPSQSGTVVGPLREGLNKVRQALSDDPRAFLKTLEEHERRVLHKIETMQQDPDCPEAVKAIASQHLPHLRAIHDEITAACRRTAA
ncbi:MAG: PA2169 family four-helix-bundle protein [Rhodothalassiaceae bacterium]